MRPETDVHWTLTGSNDKENPNSVVFWNGSVILLRDLFHYPSDPDFDELGSLEITDAFVDECGQVSNLARTTLTTRLRYQLDKFGLIPKILYASNPTKGGLTMTSTCRTKKIGYQSTRAYVPAFVTDNPYAPKEYIKLLDNLPEGRRSKG